MMLTILPGKLMRGMADITKISFRKKIFFHFSKPVK
jgi:hypothetical protein